MYMGMYVLYVMNFVHCSLFLTSFYSLLRSSFSLLSMRVYEFNIAVTANNFSNYPDCYGTRDIW